MLIHHHLPRTSQAMSSFSDLPAELLIEILERCALNDPSSPPTLARVSSAFHAIVHGTPSLWQYIELRDDDHNIPSYQHKAKMWMAKSYPPAFEVDLYIERATDNILPLLHPIIPISRRFSYEFLPRAVALSINEDSVTLSNAREAGGRFGFTNRSGCFASATAKIHPKGHFVSRVPTSSVENRLSWQIQTLLPTHKKEIKRP